MTPRDCILHTLRHEPVDRIPRNLWTLPGIKMFRADELAEMNYRYPNDILDFGYSPKQGLRAKGIPYEVGEYTDAWGCLWQVAQRGVLGKVKSGPLADLAHLGKYRPPVELFETSDRGEINRLAAATSKFTLAWTETRPFDRMQFLHGAEATFVDLGYGTKGIRDLLAMLHEVFCRELRWWAASDVDGVVFMDDWGSQSSLLISPESWRELFKPLYRQYCEILHQHDKFVFFRSDGNIGDIFDDLVQIGVDAINSQLCCMDLESLAKRFRGQVTFWGEVDRQRILPFGTRDEIRAAVRRIKSLLDFGRGGVIAQCEWGLEVPFNSIAAVFEEWLAPLPVHAQAS